MGLRLQEVPLHYFPLMSAEVRAFYGKQESTAPDPKEEIHPEAKRGSAEGKEQGEFASWLAFQKAEGKHLVVVWHGMHKRSTATRGTPDFIVGVGGVVLFIEFKRDYGCTLTDAQEEFRLACEEQQLNFHVVYSAGAAIALVRERLSLYDIL